MGFFQNYVDNFMQNSITNTTLNSLRQQMINMITQLNNLSNISYPIQMGQIADVLEESIAPQILLKQYIESWNIMVPNKNHNDDNFIHKIRYNIGEN